MQIHQIQVASDSIQDRLLLRIATQANEEFRIFITRRFLRELWPHLAAMLAGHLHQQPAIAPSADAPLPADFSQPFATDNPLYPLGATPLLASEATLDASGEGNARLTLREARERHLMLNLNGELLQALCAMLRAASEQAGWNLTLDYQPLAQRPLGGHGNTPSTLLH